MHEDYDSFERMATGISESERQNILDQLKNSSQKHEDEEMYPIEEDENIEFRPFPEQIKRESLLIRLFIWLKSLISNTTQETIFNDYKISLISKNIERNYPGLIDTKRGLILATFYNKLSELKSAAQFLKPYISEIDDDEGSFYVLLGSIVMPEINSAMNSETDPYSNPVTGSARPELRIELLRKMDAVFDSVSSEQKSKMYEAAKATEWLRQFIKLPFTRFLASFSEVTDDIYSCPYANLAGEISVFARSLCNGFLITDELLQSLFLFSKRNKNLKDADDNSEAEQFLDKAHASAALIHMFMSSVPLKSLGCIISNDIYWRAEPFSGGEDWFVKYKNAWKRIFERKWSNWIKDCKIESLKTNLRSNFSIDEFPLFPARPWADIWGGMYFKYELTAGFLFWFIVKKFPDYELALKAVLVEGDFVNKENQLAFTDAFNNIIQLSISFQGLERRCSANGEIGMMLKKIADEHHRTLKAQTKVEQLIRSVESDFETILHRFGDASRALSQVLSGILGIVKDSRFDSLSNLNTLQSKDNAAFVEDLKKARIALESSLNLIKELETLDNKKTKF